MVKITDTLASGAANENNLIVFVVDDNKDDLYLSEQTLKRSGRFPNINCVSNSDQLFTALDAKGCFKTVKDDAPKILILLDIHMPEEDGMSVLSKLRASPYTEDACVIMLTGDARTQNVEKTYQMDAHGYLSKPLKSKDLDHINDVLNSGNSSKKAWI